VAEGEFIRHLSPRTVDSITKKLPVEGRAAVWKEQVCFEIPLKIGEENPKSNVKRGMVAYWPMGSSLCVFFGESQPYGRVNIIGNVTQGLDLFGRLKSGTKIRVEKV